MYPCYRNSRLERLRCSLLVCVVVGLASFAGLLAAEEVAEADELRNYLPNPSSMDPHHPNFPSADWELDN